jgi:hypothetical protein
MLTTLVQQHLSQALPNLLSHARWVQLMPATLIPSCAYLNSRYDQCPGSAYIDATNIQVCHHKRLKRNRVFAHMAPVGQRIMGGCYGFKLHVVVNDRVY